MADSSNLPSDTSDTFSHAWHELESFADELSSLARRGVSTATFYAELLDGCVSATGAEGGAVWIPADGGGYLSVYDVKLAAMPFFQAGEAATYHARLLADAEHSEDPVAAMPSSGAEQQGPRNGSDLALVLCRVVVSGRGGA